MTTRKYAHPTARPVIKWMGGKGRLLDELVRRIPLAQLAKIQDGSARYFEPFAGGAALFFHLKPKQAVLADTNPYLCELYRQLAAGGWRLRRLIRQLQRNEREHDKEHYYHVRDLLNEHGPKWDRAEDIPAWFIYLNKSCFNGLYRVNKQGEFNVPMGRYTDPNICDPTALRAASEVLSSASVRCQDYRLATASATAGDVVYFDPPYDPISNTANFTGYGVGGFSSDDQRALADHALELTKRGAFVMLSNNNTRLIRSLYKRPTFKVDLVKVGRSVSSKTTERGSINEVLITSVQPRSRARKRARS